MSDEAEIKRLRWRCRRGMRELDQLLTRYLDQAWAGAPDSERGVFLRLLECEDDKLWRWFLGHDAPDDVEIATLLYRIAQLPP